MADVVGQVPGQLATFTSGHNPQAGVPGGGTVTSISGVSPIATVPSPIVGAGTVQFPSWPVDASGQLTNDGAGVLSWTTDAGNFVRLLADPTIDQDVGGFHVTLSGLSDTAFLVNTLTNPGDAKFRALGTTDDFIELEYTTAAANSYSGLRLQGPAARTLEINLFGSGTSGVAHGWDGTVYDLPAGSALYGAGVDAHWFKLSGSTDYTGSFQLYDNGTNFFPALSLVSIDGGAAVGAVTVGANPRVNAIPPDFSVFHGATTATGLGTERIRITNDDSEGPGTAKLVFGNLPAFATMSGNTSRDFQFVGNVANTNLLLNSNGPGSSMVSLYSLDGSAQGEGIHLIAYAQDGVEPTEYAAFNAGFFERWQIPVTGTPILSDNTEFILEANYAGGLDGQLCLYSARVGNTATTDSRVTFGAESQTGADADFVLYTGGTESLRISGATKKVTMPGVLDPPEIQVINKTPSDTATATVFMAATDSGANTSNVSAGIELPNSVGYPGDFVFKTSGSGASGAGEERLRLSIDTTRTGQFNVGAARPVTIGNPDGESGVPFVGMKSGDSDEPQFRVGGVSNYVDFFPATLAPRAVETIAFGINGSFNFVSLTGAGLFPDAATSGVLDLGVDDGGAVYNRLAWRNGYFDGNVDAASFSVGGTRVIGPPLPAHVSIGTGVSVDATIVCTSILAGGVGNVYTIVLVAGVGLNVPVSAVEVGTELTVTLGTDGAGVADPTKNTATLVKGVIDGETTLFTTALAGDGSGVLVPESQLFFGGTESITSAGGFYFAGADLYLPNLPGSDPGIPGALYQTAGAVMVSL